MLICQDEVSEETALVPSSSYSKSKIHSTLKKIQAKPTNQKTSETAVAKKPLNPKSQTPSNLTSNLFELLRVPQDCVTSKQISNSTTRN